MTLSGAEENVVLGQDPGVTIGEGAAIQLCERGGGR